ncbi:MAG: carboxypeptidase-like regulatory domain-containing protein [Terriglobia bacterium]
MMKRRFLLTTSYLIALTTGNCFVMANNGLLSIGGLIKDSQNRPLPGAIVKLVNTDSHAEQQMATDPSGKYQITNLDPGDYRLEVNMPGFQPVTKNVSLKSKI